MSEKRRNYGVDLLRIISMVFIVMLHVLGHGGVLNASAGNTITYSVVWFLEIIAYSSVNCYALISGYVGYGSKHKYSNILILYLQVVFWLLVGYGAFALWMPGSVGIMDVIKAAFPFAFNTYWYFTAYFCMFFFIPFMNKLMEELNKKQATMLVVTSIVIFSILPTVFGNDMFKMSTGSSAFWLAILYLLGAYIRKYEVADKKVSKWYWMIYIGCILVTWVCKSRFVRYDSPTVLIVALFMLLVFSKVKLKGIGMKIISFFAPLTFGVYLVHEHPLVRQHIISGRFADYTKFSPVLLVGCVIATVLIIWFVCSLADYIRLFLFKIFRIKNISNAVTVFIVSKIEKYVVRDKQGEKIENKKI